MPEAVQRAGFLHVDAGADQGGYLGDDVRAGRLADRDEPNYLTQRIRHGRHLAGQTRGRSVLAKSSPT